ncbi:very short patch repair endonuclease [Mycolicibacterium sp. Y3]
MAEWVSTDRGAHLRGRRTSSTHPEVALRRVLHARGLRFRLGRNINGYKPDIVLPHYRTAIFVDGCFWHGCPQHGPKEFTGPNARRWADKLTANRIRDIAAVEALTTAGWFCLRIWECEVEKSSEQTAQRIIDILHARSPS